MGTRRTMR